LEPEVYKTRKDENYTEYFKVGKDKSYTKVAEGPHFVSESKEVQQQEDRQVLGPHKQRTTPAVRLAEVEVRDSRGRSRKPVTHTDSWFERHFGSSSSSLSNSSVDLSRPASREGYGGLRRSASICDIRPVDNSSGVYYATVRKSAKLPQVVMRDKGDRSSGGNSQNRQSLQLSPSTTPVRPPRRKRPESASYESASNSNLYSSNNNINNSKASNLYSSSNNIANKSFESYTSTNSRRDTSSLQRGERQEGVREKYFFGHPVTVQKTPSVRVSSSNSQQGRVENRSSTLGRQTHRAHQSTGNIYRAVGRESRDPGHTGRASPRIIPTSEPRQRHHLEKERPSRYQSSQELFSESRRRGEASESRRVEEVRKSEGRHHSYKREGHSSRERGDRSHQRSQDVGKADAERKRKQSLWKEERRGRPVDIYASSREVGIRPRGPGQDPSHRIIYSTESPIGSPSTKYRTKIIVGGPG